LQHIYVIIDGIKCWKRLLRRGFLKIYLKRRKIMRKKLLALLLSMAMVMGLAGCGGGGGAGGGSAENKSNAKKVTGETEEVEFNGITYHKAKDITEDKIELTYFHFDQKETVEYLADRFMQIYPNIKVTPVYNEVGTYNQTLNTLVSDNKSPDVIMHSDADFALSNMLLQDITEYWNSDPETKKVAATINDCGLGCYETSKRYSVPVKFFPTAMYIDLNALKKLNVEAPSRNWVWSDMIKLIKDCTVKDSPDNLPYYGCGFYNRLDSYYGIAASQDIKGEFGFNGKTFDLGVWAVGEQEFADLKLGGYIAPERGTIAMENWTGNIDDWCGTTGHVALFTEAFWTFQDSWNVEEAKKFNLDIVPYVVPAVNKEDADKEVHHTISTIDFGGITTKCQYPREAYELLKFMSFGIDGWNTRIELYNDESKVDANGKALKHSVMPAPITTDEDIWNSYIDMYCKGMDEEHIDHWRQYFKSVMEPIPFGWTSIAGYWNYCDEYFNKLGDPKNPGIHIAVDSGKSKAADFADQATTKANYYHAQAMLDYFGESGYNVLSEDEVAEYTKMVEDNQ